MNGEIKPTSDALQALYGARDKGVNTRGDGDSHVLGAPTVAGEGDRVLGAPTTGGSDSVELTRKAQQLLQLEEKLAEFPAVDSQRVDAIRAAVADGTYRVDADLIAQRMLATEAEQKNSES